MILNLKAEHANHGQSHRLDGFLDEIAPMPRELGDSAGEERNSHRREEDGNADDSPAIYCVRMMSLASGV